jgi:hypothetical protein
VKKRVGVIEIPGDVSYGCFKLMKLLTCRSLEFQYDKFKLMFTFRQNSLNASLK